MRSIADQLPPDIARQIPAEWRKNEAGYWALRDQLLARYGGQWVGFADGAVIASGHSPVEVLHAAQQSARHPFVTCVGKEDAPARIRRSAFPYDASYAGEALPIVSVEFRRASGMAGVVFDRVIPDTGADSTVLPWADCQQLGLVAAAGVPTLFAGVTGGSTASVAFQTWARLDGRDHPCRLIADFAGAERILGRDVLNQLDVLFRGPGGEVVINP